MRPFRFSITMFEIESATAWQDKSRRAEELGYDVLHLLDHLGRPSPFPALTAAAAATERIKLGTFVLNAAFFNPALLAREVATIEQLSGGRFEFGIGAGYARKEFEDAGLPWTGAGARVDHLVRTVDEVYRRLRDPEHRPAAVRAHVPLLLAGNGDRVLRLAAEKADIVGFSGTKPITKVRERGGMLNAAEFAERAEFVRAAAGERHDQIELNALVQLLRLTDDREAAAEAIRTEFGLNLSVEEILGVPSILIGTPEQIAAHLVEQRERLGISHFTVLEAHLEAFGEVIKAVRA
ncbi:MAG TPA: TIGR03621 family F420-dependent LLM class oxidoreductase [Pseudonocardiaceae bacterium]|nr:TIGR03621 family F420-dependent LLM class oxidoreductase [Pseudonocardiaceae bacterium]